MDSQESNDLGFGPLGSQLTWKPPTPEEWRTYFSSEPLPAPSKVDKSPFGSLDVNSFHLPSPDQSPYGTLNEEKFQPFSGAKNPFDYGQFSKDYQFNRNNQIYDSHNGWSTETLPGSQAAACDTAQQFPAENELSNTCGIDLSKVYPKVKDSVAQVTRADGGHASAFALCTSDACGMVTNEHVTRGVDKVTLSSPERGNEVVVAKVIVRDVKHDLSLLKVIDSARGANSQALLLRVDPRLLAIGPYKPVYAGDIKESQPFFQVGHPLGRTAQVVAPGIVEKVLKEIDVEQLDKTVKHFRMNVLSTNSWGQPGGSGSAGFSLDGRAIGVVFAVNRFPEINGPGTSVVPISYAVKMLDRNRAKLLAPEKK